MTRLEPRPVRGEPYLINKRNMFSLQGTHERNRAIVTYKISICYIVAILGVDFDKFNALTIRKDILCFIR